MRKTKMTKTKKVLVGVAMSAIMLSALTVMASAAGGGSSGAEGAYKTIIEFFITWLTRAGMLVALIGGIMFGLAVTSSQVGAPSGKTIPFGIHTATIGAIPLFSVSTVSLHLIFDVYVTLQTSSDINEYGLLGTAVFKFLYNSPILTAESGFYSIFDSGHRSIGYRIIDDILYVYLLSNNAYNRGSLTIKQCTYGNPPQNIINQIIEEPQQLVTGTSDITPLPKISIGGQQIFTREVKGQIIPPLSGTVNLGWQPKMVWVWQTDIGCVSTGGNLNQFNAIKDSDITSTGFNCKGYLENRGRNLYYYAIG